MRTAIGRKRETGEAKPEGHSLLCDQSSLNLQYFDYSANLFMEKNG
jgi:hypothetical protein